MHKYIYRCANCTVVVPMNVVRISKETNRHSLCVCQRRKNGFPNQKLLCELNLSFSGLFQCAFLYNMAKIDELYVQMQRSSRRRYYIEFGSIIVLSLSQAPLTILRWDFILHTPWSSGEFVFHVYVIFTLL